MQHHNDEATAGTTGSQRGPGGEEAKEGPAVSCYGPCDACGGEGDLLPLSPGGLVCDRCASGPASLNPPPAIREPSPYPPVPARGAPEGRFSNVPRRGFEPPRF